MDNRQPVLFGEWIKQRRKALDLTQDELAQRAGCSIFALRKIESGERRPSKQLAGLLADALDISAEDKPIFVRIARGDLPLERLRIATADSKPVSFLNSKSVPHHLPLPATALLGRDSELAAIAKLFNNPQRRLLTLTGMGGIGKTRLAIEFALRQHTMFPDGVYYVPLASLDSAELIVPAVAEAVEFAFSGPSDPKEQLIHFMADRMKQSALLILDNLEHLITQTSAAVELITEMLQRLPHVKILATSRERLNLHGEWTYELYGLPVPPTEYFNKVDDYSAAVLFMESARRIKSDFDLTADEKPMLVRICQLLDGVPLAIELAAAWVGTLSCVEIAREIESNIDFLTTTMRDIPERHRSLRATFDHSWQLLSNAERDVLCRLAISHGGFDRNAAEHIAGATLPLLSSLVSKSLVRRTETGRYDLHEVIHRYALTRLDEDESRRLESRDRHSEYYLHLASTYERKLKSASQQAAMREMAIELDNVRAAWGWGIKNEKIEIVGKAVRALGWYFEVAGLIHEGIDQFEVLVQALPKDQRDTLSNKVLGSALVQQGLLCFRSGQFVRAQKLYRDAIAILRSVNEQALLADALIFSGTIMHLNGDYLEAKELIAEGLAYARAANDSWFAAYGVYNLGHVDSLMGEYQKGFDQMQEGLRLWRELGDPHSISLGLNFRVETQIALGRHAEAIAAMHESIGLCERTKNRWGMGTAYRYLGLATMATGRCVEARRYFETSLEVFGEYFKGWDIARTLIYLGDSYILSYEPSKAKSILLDALQLARDIRSTPLVLDAVAALASLEICLDPMWMSSELRTIANHPAATHETKERICHLLQKAAQPLGQTGVPSQDTPHRALEIVTATLLRSGE